MNISNSIGFIISSSHVDPMSHLQKTVFDNCRKQVREGVIVRGATFSWVLIVVDVLFYVWTEYRH